MTKWESDTAEQERDIDPSSYVDKADLVRKVEEVAASGPVVAGAPTQVGGHPVPPGFAYEPSSGYYYNSESQMSFDPVSGGYFCNNRWYAWDANLNQFVEWRS
ncbi:CD2 antigen cytoplasmic tail-binding 2 [Haematococcus lacustris]|uniref:CD2 antigen cytoplasmic tail-binding 2 n=1 Tax=Haematococcus lacustris TaxID=44745 RepID=A0A699YDJ4_HAELA|nr:CD2 antigen cytoplasmic tail-binding 2 [Haematococcus lacustris]